MNSKFKKTLLLFFIFVLLLGVTACNSKTDKNLNNSTEVKNTNVSVSNKDNSETEGNSLFVYCGAGLKKPMTDIAKIYEEKTGTKIEYTFAGSGQLISQLEVSGEGDVLIIGSETVYKKAKDKGLVGEYNLVSHHTPAIGVPKGNPKNIEKLSDLAKDSVKVIVGDKEANAIGKTAEKIFEKNNLQDIKNNVIATPATVNEIVTALAAGECDAAIVTKDSVFGNENIDIVEISEEENIDQIIPIGTVNNSKKMESAKNFCDFVASDEGVEIFAKYGFEPYKK